MTPEERDELIQRLAEEAWDEPSAEAMHLRNLRNLALVDIAPDALEEIAAGVAAAPDAGFGMAEAALGDLDPTGRERILAAARQAAEQGFQQAANTLVRGAITIGLEPEEIERVVTPEVVVIAAASQVWRDRG